MSAFDAQMQFILLYVVLPVATLYVLSRVLRRQILDQFAKLFALVLNRLSPLVHKKMEKQEVALFSELKALDEASIKPLRLVEVGVGAGMNFKYFPPGTDVVCVDPNPHFRQYVDVNISLHSHVNMVEFIVGTAEDMGRVESSSVDVVVCTHVLCSVSDVDGALGEIRRILKPGGKFFFMEHVSAEDKTWLLVLQNLLGPLWKTPNGNCNLNRRTWMNISKAGFSNVQIKNFTADFGLMGKLVSPHIMGTAAK